LRNVESLVRELEQLLGSWRESSGEGVVAASPTVLAARLLGRAPAELEHASQAYGRGLPRTLALHHLTARVCPERGFELFGYERTSWTSSYFLKVPVRREPIVVGPDERRVALAAAWGVHAADGIVVHTDNGEYEGQAFLECWSRDPGVAAAFVAETDRAVDACTLVQRRAVRLRENVHDFLHVRRPPVEPRHSTGVERAVGMIAAFLEDGEPAEHLGTLWHGPPGNGKTSMVRRLMREATTATRVWVDPSAMSGESLDETLSVLGRILRSLDEREAALVVFEDLDLLSGQRGSSSEIRTWLSALDGVEQYRCRVCYVGLTNLTPRDFDPAVVRPARLGDLVVEFAPPDLPRRELILSDHLGRHLDPEVLEELAVRTHGWSGAELELLCRRVRWARKKAGGPLDPADLDRIVGDLRPRAAATVLGFGAMLE